jgi:hypothetical protein
VKRGNGYTVVVELEPDPVTGKRRQKWHSDYRTKRAADAAALVAGLVSTPLAATGGDGRD